jgi:predicted DsbA family dithiol-disulfide isomerase
VHEAGIEQGSTERLCAKANHMSSASETTANGASKNFQIDVWSDIACPWCYVGKRRMEAALAKFAHRENVSVVWHAFELDESAPKQHTDGSTYAQRLAEKYGRSVPEAQGMIDNMTDTARADGLDFRFDRVKSGNTFDAHRVIHFAAHKGKQDAVKEALLKAYMTDGDLVSDHQVLIRIASHAGLDANEVGKVLAEGAYTDEVRADEQDAREIGIRGVPFFVLGGKYAVSGAQPAAVLLGAIEKAWAERNDANDVSGHTHGASCGVDGCA